ncbi:MAG: hypothetical protein JWL79_928 [Frankiales bacterium]|nr:hypothetical protein [Frankiales bacterium]
MAEQRRSAYLNGGRVERTTRGVRRSQQHRWPAAVTEALLMLRQAGFAGAPLVLEQAAAGTVELTWIPGRVLPDPVPRWAARRSVLRSVIDLVAAATRSGTGVGSRLVSHDWLVPPMAGDCFIHGDPHPGNVVFERRQPVGLIDFEVATVGSDITALASLIFGWAPAEPLPITPWRGRVSDADAAARVREIARRWPTAHGPEPLVGAMGEFLDWRAGWLRLLSNAGNQNARAALLHANDPDYRRASCARVADALQEG